MKHLVRRLSGIPLYLIGVLALVIGLSGAATAGALITGKQIKDSTVTSKDVKDGSLLLRDLKRSEAAKLRGKDGANGANGATGANGTNGTNGKDGKDGASAFAPLPSGTVITGGGVLDAHVSAANADLRSYAPLPFTPTTPLSSGTGRNLFFGGALSGLAGSGENPTACPGAFNNPTSTPGNLCVYLVATSNVALGTAFLYAGVDAGTDAADRHGFYVFGTSGAAGEMIVRYVWAYQAP